LIPVAISTHLRLGFARLAPQQLSTGNPSTAHGFPGPAISLYTRSHLMSTCLCGTEADCFPPYPICAILWRPDSRRCSWLHHDLHPRLPGPVLDPVQGRGRGDSAPRQPGAPVHSGVHLREDPGTRRGSETPPDSGAVGPAGRALSSGELDEALAVACDALRRAAEVDPASILLIRGAGSRG